MSGPPLVCQWPFVPDRTLTRCVKIGSNPPSSQPPSQNPPSNTPPHGPPPVCHPPLVPDRTLNHMGR